MLDTNTFGLPGEPTTRGTLAQIVFNAYGTATGNGEDTTSKEKEPSPVIIDPAKITTPEIDNAEDNTLKLYNPEQDQYDCECDCGCAETGICECEDCYCPHVVY